MVGYLWFGISPVQGPVCGSIPQSGCHFFARAPRTVVGSRPCDWLSFCKSESAGSNPASLRAVDEWPKSHGRKPFPVTNPFAPHPKPRV